MLNQNTRSLAFKDYYPKVEYLRSDFITHTNIIRNLIFAIQQVTITQVWLGSEQSRKVKDTFGIIN